MPLSRVLIVAAVLALGCGGKPAKARPDARDLFKQQDAEPAAKAPVTRPAAKTAAGPVMPAVEALRAVKPGESWIAQPRAMPSEQDPEAACEAGDPVSCFVIASFYEQGVGGVRKDVTKAASLFERGCKAGVPLACYNLGVYHEQGIGMEVDTGAALAYLTRACEGGDPRGCGEIGYMFERGAGVAQDVQAARAIYTRACNALDMQACNNLAWLLLNDATPDVARAAQLYERACAKGYERACPRYAYLEARGCLDATRTCAPLPADESEYLGLVRAECEARKSPASCVALGSYFEAGQGVPADAARARALFTRTCDAGHVWGCARLAAMVRWVDKDLPRAEVLYDKACAGGFAAACADLGMLRVVADDPATAVELQKRACRDGMPRACATLVTFCALGGEPACTL